MADDTDSIITWLQEEHSLSEFQAKFPEEWQAAQQHIAKVISDRDPEQGEPFLDNDETRVLNKQYRHKELSKYIQTQMLHKVIKNQYLSVATGVTTGKIRFNLLNGYLVQRLLFKKGLERKPVSMYWFRLLWPIIWQRKFLMPLVEAKGIYCFYSKQLINEIARLVGSRSCLEIAAGDGTLSRFLKEQGVKITATDNQSWKHAIQYADSVIPCDAKEALQQYKPEVVICSWPPANNDFERRIFKTKSVQTYILIASSYEFASGNWADYRKQTAFSFEEDNRLSQLVLPPELECAVYVFTRQSTG